MKINITSELFEETKDTVDKFLYISSCVSHFWEDVYNFYRNSERYKLKVCVVAYALKTYYIDKWGKYYYTPTIEEIRAIIGPVEKAIKSKNVDKLLRYYIIAKNEETFYLECDVESYLKRICIAEYYRKYRIKPNKYNPTKISSSTIEEAKNILEKLEEDNYSLIRWYRKSNAPYKLKITAVACAIVSGYDTHYNWYYKKPTTKAVKEILPMVEKAIKKKHMLKIVYVDKKIYSINNLILFEKKGGMWKKDQPKEECDWAKVIDFGYYQNYDNNIYGVDMHKDPAISHV